jgi:hypothetical protein
VKPESQAGSVLGLPWSNMTEPKSMQTTSSECRKVKVCQDTASSHG